MERYTARNRAGERVSVSGEEYARMTGGGAARAYIARVYAGRMTLEAVPEELRGEVEAAAAARTEFSGAYRLTAEEALDIILGGDGA